MSHKTALLIDSCTDVPKEYIEKYNMFVVPLMVNYSFGEFRDGIDITAQEVYDRFEQEIPKTSLPGAHAVAQAYSDIAALGYDRVVAVTISSGLSGTYSLFSVTARDFPQLDCRVIDTKNIGIGAGLTAILAGKLISSGMELDDIARQLEASVKNTAIYFCVSTLEYLQKGGRIGLVSATMGALLGILPVISCNEDGIYYTVKKVRGRKAVLESAVKLAAEHLSGCARYNLAVVHGGARDEINGVIAQVKKLLPDYETFITGQISPALVVHTGPGLIGICAQKI